MKKHLLVVLAALLSACATRITTATSPDPFAANAILSGRGGGIMDGGKQIGTAKVTQQKGAVFWRITIETQEQILVVSADGATVKAFTEKQGKHWLHTFPSPKKIKKIGIYYQ